MKESSQSGSNVGTCRWKKESPTGIALYLTLHTPFKGVRKGLCNWEVLSSLEFPAQGVPGVCPTIAPLPTIQKRELKCLHNREAITTLFSGQQ